MCVNEFLSFEKSGATFYLVDANKVGYMTHPQIMAAGDRNYVGNNYGDNVVVGFEPKKKGEVLLYIK